MTIRLNVKPERKHRLWLYGSLAILAIVWAIWTWVSVHYADRDFRNEVLIKTSQTSESLNLDHFKALSGNKTDLENQSYLRIKDQLTVLKQSYVYCRALYILGRKPDGSVFVFVESEQPSIKDNQPPVHIVQKVSEIHQLAFKTGTASVEGPFHDHQDTWFSVFVPIRAPRSTGIIAVMGMDLDPQPRKQILLQAALPPTLLAMILLAIILTGSTLIRRRRRLAEFPVSWMRYLEFALVFAAGLSLTLFVSWKIHQNEHYIRHQIFEQLAAERISAVVELLGDIRDIQLEGLAHFIESSDNVTADEFSHYASYLTKQSFIQAWEWIPIVPDAEKERFEAKTRRAGMKDFKIWQQNTKGDNEPATGRGFYYPVLYIAPSTGNEKTLGYDIGSETLQRAGLETALRTGFVTATDPVTLMHEKGNHKAILIFLPTYFKKLSTKPQGVVLAVVRMGTLLETARRNLDTQTELILLRKGGTPELLATTCDEKRQHLTSEFIVSKPVMMLGKVFVVKAHADPEFFRLHPANAGWVAALMGLLLTTALAFVVGTVLLNRKKLKFLVNQQTSRLRESEKQFRTLVSNIPGITYRCKYDRDWTMLYISETIDTVSGYPASDFISNTVRSFESIIHHDDTGMVETRVREAVGKGTSWEIEYRIIHRDTSVRWVYEKGQAIRDPSGAIPYLDGFILDITKRKRAEQEREEALAALCEREERLKLMMAATDEGFWTWDAITNELECSPSMLRSLGFAENDNSFNYQWFISHLSRKSIHVFEEAMKAYLDGRKKYYEFQYLIKAKTGEWKWLSARGSCTMRSDNGRLLKFMGTIRDITDQKQAEKEREAAQEALRLKSEELHRYFTSSLDLLCIADTSGHFLRVNPEWEKVLGYYHEELEGRLFLDFVHPDDMKATLEAMSDLDSQRKC